MKDAQLILHVGLIALAFQGACHHQQPPTQLTEPVQPTVVTATVEDAGVVTGEADAAPIEPPITTAEPAWPGAFIPDGEPNFFNWFYQGDQTNCASIALLKAAGHTYGRDNVMQVRIEGETVHYRMRDGFSGTFPVAFLTMTENVTHLRALGPNGGAPVTQSDSPGIRWANERTAAAAARMASDSCSPAQPCPPPTEAAFNRSLDYLMGDPSGVNTTEVVAFFGLSGDNDTLQEGHATFGSFIRAGGFVTNHSNTANRRGACASISGPHAFFTTQGLFDSFGRTVVSNRFRNLFRRGHRVTVNAVCFPRLRTAPPRS